jgi:anti-sigma regulatory factor (Ser/Thr protein kinase)
MNHWWPFQDFLELGALVSAVPCARLHARQVLWEWGIGNLSDSAELLVTELITNAIRASREAGRDSAVRLWLLSDSAQILILVWDASPRPPVLNDASDEAEHGRGLMLIDAVSEQWGWYSREHSDGKFVWAITRLCIPGGSHHAEITAGITQSRKAAVPRCQAQGPGAGRPVRDAGKGLSVQTW